MHMIINLNSMASNVDGHCIWTTNINAAVALGINWCASNWLNLISPLQNAAIIEKIGRCIVYWSTDSGFAEQHALAAPTIIPYLHGCV